MCYTVHGKILEREIFVESLLLKQSARKSLVNLLAVYISYSTVFIYVYWRGKFGELYTIYHSPNSPMYDTVELKHTYVCRMIVQSVYRIREKFRGRKVSWFSRFYSYSESFYHEIFIYS